MVLYYYGEKMSENETEPQKPLTKRIPDLDEDEEMVQCKVYIPKKYMKKLDGLSMVKEQSKGAIVREALKNYFEKQERPIEPLTSDKILKIPNEVITDLLRKCTTYWGNFKIDGDDGFIALVKERGIKLKDLTEEQFKEVLENLVVGYKGYAFKPSIDEFIGKFSELELSDKQKDMIRQAIAEISEEDYWEEEEEENPIDEDEEDW